MPGGYQAQAPALQAALLSVFDALKQTFHYFCITGAGSPFLLSQKEYARFLLDAGVAQAEHPLLTKPKCLAFFKVRPPIPATPPSPSPGRWLFSRSRPILPAYDAAHSALNLAQQYASFTLVSRCCERR